MRAVMAPELIRPARYFEGWADYPSAPGQAMGQADPAPSLFFAHLLNADQRLQKLAFSTERLWRLDRSGSLIVQCGKGIVSPEGSREAEFEYGLMGLRLLWSVVVMIGLIVRAGSRRRRFWRKQM